MKALEIIRSAITRRSGTSTPSTAPTATTSTPTTRPRCAGREGARRRLQPLRLRRDQAARLALLRELDAERLPPPRRRQLPDGAHRAQGGHLALLQGVPRARTARQRRAESMRATGRCRTSSAGTRASARRSPSSGSTATRRSSRSATTRRCSAYMAYSGMPSHYPHWSYGKAYEKLKTLYDHGVSGLPYEMVINSNPALAYLMRDNSLCLQILTIAHVYGHNDFFKNNFTFKSTRAEFTIGDVQGARRPRAALRRHAEHRHRQGRVRARRRARALAPVPAEPRRSRSSPSEEERERLVEAASPGTGPVPAHPPARRARRARPAGTSARARRGPAALHPRPQPVPRRAGSRTSSPSSTSRRSTSSRRSRRRS